MDFNINTIALALLAIIALTVIFIGAGTLSITTSIIGFAILIGTTITFIATT